MEKTDPPPCFNLSKLKQLGTNKGDSKDPPTNLLLDISVSEHQIPTCETNNPNIVKTPNFPKLSHQYSNPKLGEEIKYKQPSLHLSKIPRINVSCGTYMFTLGG